MHRRARMRACSSLCSPKIMKGLETSAEAESSPGNVIETLYNSDIDSSSGTRNSSCTCAKTKRYGETVMTIRGISLDIWWPL